MKHILTLLLLALSVSVVTAQPNDRIAKTPKVNYDWRPGFVSITEFTGAFGLINTSTPYSRYYYGITTMAGYQFTRNIKAGVGAGVHLHNDGTLFPLYLDFRYSFNSQNIIPFISGTGGAAFNLRDIDMTYLYINPAIGIKWVAANRTGISFSSGLNIMTAPGGRNSFINFKLGLELKAK